MEDFYKSLLWSRTIYDTEVKAVFINGTNYTIQLVDCKVRVLESGARFFPKAIGITVQLPLSDPGNKFKNKHIFCLTDVDTSDVVYVAGIEYLANCCFNLRMIGYADQPLPDRGVEQVKHKPWDQFSPYNEMPNGRLTKAAK